MEKFKNEKGQVAVLYSINYGSGWFSWNKENPKIVFCPELVKAVLQCEEQSLEGEEKVQFLEPIAKKLLPDIYLGGLDGLTVQWLNEGTAFIITEYDGYESIETFGENCLCA